MSVVDVDGTAYADTAQVSWLGVGVGGHLALWQSPNRH